jgi:hypothetical protein
MYDDFRDLLHTHSSCPFCGHFADEPALVGLNCVVCEPCRENVAYWSPSFAKIATEDGVFELFDYIPVADTWEESGSSHAVFLDPQQDVADLSKSTQRVIVAFVEYRYQDLLERVPLDRVDLDTLSEQTHKPIIATGDWVYAQDTDQLQLTSDGGTQVTLADAV